MLLAEKANRNAQDDKKLNAIVKAEKTSLRATKARQEAANLINAEKKAAAKAERTARTHELCNSAGLLILAGLVDTKSGQPTIDKGELLGALLGLAKVTAEDPRRLEWKRAGCSTYQSLKQIRMCSRSQKSDRIGFIIQQIDQ